MSLSRQAGRVVRLLTLLTFIPAVCILVPVCVATVVRSLVELRAMMDGLPPGDSSAWMLPAVRVLGGSLGLFGTTVLLRQWWKSRPSASQPSPWYRRFLGYIVGWSACLAGIFVMIAAVSG